MKILFLFLVLVSASSTYADTIFVSYTKTNYEGVVEFEDQAKITDYDSDKNLVCDYKGAGSSTISLGGITDDCMKKVIIFNFSKGAYRGDFNYCTSSSVGWTVYDLGVRNTSISSQESFIKEYGEENAEKVLDLKDSNKWECYQF